MSISYALSILLYLINLMHVRRHQI